MATSINSYSVKLSMDATGFVDATKVSRSEARQLIREIEGAQSPMEKFAVQQDRWRRQLEQGAISQGTYNRLLSANAPAAMSTTAALGPLAIGITAVATAATAAVAGGVAFTGWMRDVQERLDEAADKAERLGVGLNDLNALKFGFAEGGGLDGASVETALEKFQIGMAKAVEGDEGIRKAFGKLGLDAGELMGVGPQEAMLRVADSMQGINDHADRMRISMELFGKGGADLASTLGKGRDAIEEAMNFHNKWNSISDEQLQTIASLNDSMGRVSLIVEGVVNRTAGELAPAFEAVASVILDGAEGLDGVGEKIRFAVDTGVAYLGVMIDVSEVIKDMAERAHALATLDLKKALTVDEGVFQFDTADRLLVELEAKREKARLAGLKAVEDREAKRTAKELLDTEAVAKAKLDGIEKAAKEQQRLQDQADKEQRRAAEQGLQMAEAKFQKEIERQRKMREDVAKGPGSGMEVGSAEAARFMAEQANAAIAESTVGVDQPPTDQQLVETAKIQLEIMRAQQVKQDAMISAVKDVGNAIKDNGWEAV